MKRTPLQRKTGLKPGGELKRTTGLARSTKPLRHATPKRAAQNALFRTARAEYLAVNPICCWPGCHLKAGELHHARGRVGADLWDKRFFRGLCMAHHRRAHDYPLEAKANGISVSRLGENGEEE